MMNKFYPKQFKKFICLALLLMLIPLAGCGPTQEQISTQTAVAQTAIAGLWTPTSTPTPIPIPSATPTPSATSTIASTPMAVSGNVTTFTLKDITFSLLVPDGWSATSETKRIILKGPIISGIQTILTFSLDQYSLGDAPLDADWMGIAMFSAHVQDTISGMVQKPVSLSEDFLETPDGLPYFRWEMEHSTNGKENHMVFYIFGTGKWFLTGMYGRVKADGAEMDAIIDEVMKTLKFE